MIILNVDEGAMRRALSYIAAGSVNWYNLSGKQFGIILQKIFKCSYSLNQQFLFK